MTVLAPYRALLAARLFLLCRRSLTLCQARDHGKSGSLIRSTALLPRSKLGTRHTPDDMYSPTRQPAKRCREPAATFCGSRPRRSSAPRARRSTWRGDRHPVRCRWRVGASLRLGGGLHGSARRRCADCTTPAPLTTPTGSGAAHMELRTAPVHRSRAQLGAGVGQVACSL